MQCLTHQQKQTINLKMKTVISRNITYSGTKKDVQYNKMNKRTTIKIMC